MKGRRAEEAGTRMADAIVEFIHLMYQKSTATRVILSLIGRLQERTKEFSE